MNEANIEGDEEVGFRVLSSIPVLRMLDEARSKAFYLDFLGFEIDWEHRFRDNPASPLYLQIHLGDCVLHLNGHADADAPTSEVRVPVDGLELFCDHLRSVEIDFEKPEIVDPRYEGRKTDLNLIDPSSNLIVFWAPSYLAS